MVRKEHISEYTLTKDTTQLIMLWGVYFEYLGDDDVIVGLDVYVFVINNTI